MDSSLIPVSLDGIKTYAFKDKLTFIEFIQGLTGKILIAVNAEKLLNADPRLREIINNNVGYPDGIGAVIALRKMGLDSVKLAGVELWQYIIKENYREKSFYLIGGKQEIIEKTVERLKIEYPGINIVNYRNGYFSENEKPGIAEDIKAKKPDIVFVALGSPVQEYFMEDLLKVHPALYMGLGGSFDIYAGTKKRAPKIFLILGLEWFYRLVKEPTRIKRQLKLFKFIGNFLINRY